MRGLKAMPYPVLLILLTSLCTPAWGQNEYATELFLDPAAGEIDGKVAVVVYPARFEQGQVGEVLASNQFKAHLVMTDDPSVELTYPCGEWFQPPARHRYRVWVESEWQMSPYTSQLSYGGGPFTGRGLGVALPAVDAGRVTLPAEITGHPKIWLRLMRAEDHSEGDLARRELTRRVTTDKVHDGVLMPAGKVIAALWDERSQSYTALSRPFEVRARETVSAPLEAPQEGADLVVALNRHHGVAHVEGYDVEMRLVTSAGERPPDVKIPSKMRVYGVWYGVEAGKAELHAESSLSTLPPQKLTLTRGEIHRLGAKLQEK